MPYLRIQDVPSTGLVTRVRGWKTGRVHHLLSKLERMFFFTLEWSRFVVDIREQYPLDIDRTLAIAKDLGVRHPCLPGTDKPIVMTTDFVVTSRHGLQIIDRARSVKPASKLLSARTLEKLEIERIYWGGFDWGITTERDINLILSTNVERIHKHRDTAFLQPITEAVIQRIEPVLTSLVLGQNLPLRDHTNHCDRLFDLPSGSSLTISYHLLATSKWRIDMTRPIQPSMRLMLITAPSSGVIDRKAI